MWYNTLMSWLLRSPLHGLLSKSTLLITVIGRKSGKQYTLPVNYVRDDESLWLTSQRDRTWWRNLLGSAPVSLVLQGQRLTAQAQAFEDGAAVAAGLQAYFRQAPGVARYFNVRLNDAGKPLEADLAKAAKQRVVIKIETLRH